MYRRLDVLLPEDHYSAGKKKLRTPFGTILAIVVGTLISGSAKVMHLVP